MATTVKPKRTFTPGKVPTTSDLADGEVGINVPDGKIYVRQGTEVKLVGTKAEGTVRSVTALGGGAFSTIELFVNNIDSANPVLSLQFPYMPSSHVLAGPPHVGAPPVFRALTTADISGGVFDRARIPYPPDYISGFKITTVSNAIVVSAGEAMMGATGTVVASAGATITSSRLAGATYHLYLNSTGSILRSDEIPDAPYFNTARMMMGYTSNFRYLGTVKVDLSGSYYTQTMTPSGNSCNVIFTNNTTTNAILQNGGATTATDVSAAAFVPSTATRLVLAVRSEAAGAARTVRLYGWNGLSFNIWGNLPFIGAQVDMTVPCDSTPKIRYDVLGDMGATLMVRGYEYER